jgi:hypothetical protein
LSRPAAKKQAISSEQLPDKPLTAYRSLLTELFSTDRRTLRHCPSLGLAFNRSEFHGNLAE